MKLIKLSWVTFSLIFSSLFSIQVWSHGGHGGGGFGGGYSGFHGRGYINLYANPYFYGYPYYNYPYNYNSSPTIIVPSSPIYIEQNTTENLQDRPVGYWYYCTNPAGYYPYVKECTADWQKVNPIPNNH